jgi:hypothetical protein
MEWLDHFAGGLLTTCGLRSVGSPSRHGEIDWPLHGVITHRAAERCSWRLDHSAQAIVCEAEVREASSLGPNLLLRRAFRLPLASSRILVEDTITNEGYEAEPVQLLYHVNLGWPLSSRSARWRFPAASTAVAVGGGPEIDSGAASASVPDGESRIFRHHPGTEADRVEVSVAAPVEEGDDWVVSATVRYSRSDLPALWQWVDRRPGRYVVGIEPALGSVEGRAASAGEGLLPELEPGASRRTCLELDFGIGSDADGEAREC